MGSNLLRGLLITNPNNIVESIQKWRAQLYLIIVIIMIWFHLNTFLITRQRPTDPRERTLNVIESRAHNKHTISNGDNFSQKCQQQSEFFRRTSDYLINLRFSRMNIQQQLLIPGTLITLASIHTKDERATVDTMPNVISPGNIIDSTANTSAVAVLLRPTVKPTDRSLLLKSREQRGTIDARRLVGIVLLFTGTTLICIGEFLLLEVLKLISYTLWGPIILICAQDTLVSEWRNNHDTVAAIVRTRIRHVWETSISHKEINDLQLDLPATWRSFPWRAIRSAERHCHWRVTF